MFVVFCVLLRVQWVWFGFALGVERNVCSFFFFCRVCCMLYDACCSLFVVSRFVALLVGCCSWLVVCYCVLVGCVWLCVVCCLLVMCGVLCVVVFF